MKTTYFFISLQQCARLLWPGKQLSEWWIAKTSQVITLYICFHHASALFQQQLIKQHQNIPTNYLTYIASKHVVPKAVKKVKINKLNQHAVLLDEVGHISVNISNIRIFRLRLQHNCASTGCNYSGGGNFRWLLQEFHHNCTQISYSAWGLRRCRGGDLCVSVPRAGGRRYR